MEEKGFEHSLEGRVGFGCTEPFGKNIPGRSDEHNAKHSGRKDHGPVETVTYF